LLKEYGIPESSLKLIYGGNLGKPQGIDFLLEALKSLSDQDDVFTLIVGDGTEYNKVARFLEAEKISNARLFKTLPKEQYTALLRTMDVGLVFLDHRFTIPNFPSRLLDYLDASLPVIAATDPITDIGLVLEKSGTGLHCESDSVSDFLACINVMKDVQHRVSYGIAAKQLVAKTFNSARSADMILNIWNSKKKTQPLEIVYPDKRA
jgi:glycosyltransferase involved in cell wall biosynthesis